MSQLTPEDFRRQYLGEFRPDPAIPEIVAFLRGADPKDVSRWKIENRISPQQYREARRILDRESRQK